MRSVTSLERLTEKQQQFVLEYLVDLNGYQAAIRAGYSSAGARVEAARLLANANVHDAIKREMEARGERTRVTADRVLNELSRIAFGSIRSVASWTSNGGVTFIDSDEVDDETIAAIQEISEKRTITRQRGKGDDSETVNIQLKAKMHDKLRALEMLAKHLGILQAKEDDGDGKIKKLSNQELLKLVKENLTELEAG